VELTLTINANSATDLVVIKKKSSDTAESERGADEATLSCKDSSVMQILFIVHFMEHILN
jgi:hypothetical protein